MRVHVVHEDLVSVQRNVLLFDLQQVVFDELVLSAELVFFAAHIVNDLALVLVSLLQL